MLEKEATALGTHPAFIPTYTMFLFDIIDVGSNVILGKLFWIEMVIIGKNIAHLCHIVADGHMRICFCLKERSKFEQILLSGIIEGYGAQRVFFEFS